MMTVGSSADQGSVYLDAWSIVKWEADYSDLEKRIIVKTFRAFEELEISLPQIGKLDVPANAVKYDTKKAMMAMVKNGCIDCILIIHDDDTLHDVKAQIYAAYKKTMISAEYLRKKFAIFQEDDREPNYE